METDLLDGSANFVSTDKLVSGTAQDGVFEFTLHVPQGSTPGQWNACAFLKDLAQRESDYGKACYSENLPFPEGNPILQITGNPEPTEFKISGIEIQRHTGTILISFPIQEGRSYLVESSHDLKVFIPENTVTGSGEQRERTVELDLGEESIRYYRVTESIE